MLKLTLTKRPAKVGKAVNTRTEMHGTEEVPALDIPITGILINTEELAALCDEPTASTAFFKDQEGQQVPRITALAPSRLEHKFENAVVRITGSSIDNVTFEGAKIKGILLLAQTGGMCHMSCTLQVHPPAHFDVPAFLNAKISVGIKSAELERDAEDQPELPMEHNDEIGEAMEEEDEATRQATGELEEPVSRTGRAIGRSSRKKK